MQQELEARADGVEGELYRCAVEGVVKPTGWFRGEPGAYLRECSDLFLIVLLKSLRPEKYKDRLEVGGPWVPRNFRTCKRGDK